MGQSGKFSNSAGRVTTKEVMAGILNKPNGVTLIVRSNSGHLSIDISNLNKKSGVYRGILFLILRLSTAGNISVKLDSS